MNIKKTKEKEHLYERHFRKYLEGKMENNKSAHGKNLEEVNISGKGKSITNHPHREEILK